MIPTIVNGEFNDLVSQLPEGSSLNVEKVIGSSLAVADISSLSMLNCVRVFVAFRTVGTNDNFTPIVVGTEVFECTLQGKIKANRANEDVFIAPYFPDVGRAAEDLTLMLTKEDGSPVVVRCRDKTGIHCDEGTGPYLFLSPDDARPFPKEKTRWQKLKAFFGF